MTPDQYQHAVIEDVASGEGHTVVCARAGSGKTTTILGALERVPRGKSVLVCAFNQKIKLELAAKVQARGLRAEVLTLHGYGARQCRAPLDVGKLARIADECLGGAPREYVREVMRGVALAKGKLLRERADVARLVEEHQLEVEPGEEARFAEDVLAIMVGCYHAAATVDFDDQVWLPLARRMRVWQYDRVFIDETQDLNLAQIRLALAACKPGGRICAVGDDRQAIYAFRGADRHALPRVVDELGAKALPLSVSYRCPWRVVELARELVPSIEAAPDAPEGIVERVNEARLLREAGSGDFVVSRKNAPLVKLCLRLLRQGMPAAVLGRDIGAELGSIIQASRARVVPRLLDWVARWEARQVRRARDANPEADVSRFRDTAECLRALAEGAETVDDVRAQVRRLFDEADDDASRVTLMSTHKAKGLEAGRVWLLRDTYAPEKSVEEENLLYVGITRAKRELYLVQGVE